MSDTCEDIDNDSNITPAGPKPQPIFMKLTENFTEIISFLENSLNNILKKKVAGDLIQINPADVNIGTFKNSSQTNLSNSMLYNQEKKDPRRSF